MHDTTAGVRTELVGRYGMLAQKRNHKITSSTTSHSHHNRYGCVLLRVDARSVMYAQVVGSASTANAVEQNTFRDSQRVACISVGPRRIPRKRRERSHGGGGCSHLLRAQVLGGAVINFLVNLSKTQTSSASLNGRRMRQRDAGRAVLISSQRHVQSQPSKNSSGSGFDTNLQDTIVFR